jgi:hypothetical protein
MNSSIGHARTSESFDLRFGKSFWMISQTISTSIWKINRAKTPKTQREISSYLSELGGLCAFAGDIPILWIAAALPLRDINQVLFDDLPITWLDRPVRDDFRADAKGIFNSIRKLTKPRPIWGSISTKISTSLSSR